MQQYSPNSRDGLEDGDEMGDEDVASRDVVEIAVAIGAAEREFEFEFEFEFTSLLW